MSAHAGQNRKTPLPRQSLCKEDVEAPAVAGGQIRSAWAAMVLDSKIAQIVALLVLAGFPAEATLVPRLTLEDLSRQADLIVQGRIAASRVSWGPEHRLLWTHYEVNVDSSLKGPREVRLTVSVPGGKLGSAVMTIAGTPHFVPGERVILFLYRTPVGYWGTVGFSQGCFKIAGGRVDRDLTGLEFAQRGTIDADGMSFAEFNRRLGAVLGKREVINK